MNFDPRDLIDSNLQLLQEAEKLKEPQPAILLTVATWGRGADPEMLLALQPYRHGLGYNGSIVARVPQGLLDDWISEDGLAQLKELQRTAPQRTPVYSAVFKDWRVELL